MRKRVHMRKMGLNLGYGPQEAVNQVLLLDLLWIWNKYQNHSSFSLKSDIIYQIKRKINLETMTDFRFPFRDTDPPGGPPTS